MSHNGRKSADMILAAALAAGQSVREAAEVAGVSETTAWRRKKDPAFSQLVADLRGEMLESTLGRLSEAGTEAAIRLRELLRAGSEAVALGAARSILDGLLSVKKHVELEERIRRLEAAAGNS